MATDPFNSVSTLDVDGTSYRYHRLAALDEQGVGVGVDKLPYSIRVLLEAMLRNIDGFVVTADDVSGLASYNAKGVNRVEMPFMPGRVVLQDFTGVPCVVDLAAMRDAMKGLGGDPEEINPAVKCDLVIDHSVQVDDFASRVALTVNAEKEFERNNERYRFLKWGQESLSSFTVVPPATGIVHQVNLEYLARGILTRDVDGQTEVFPDSLVGTDSHTTMIDALGVVGWGVGGIEAEAVMLGQPVYMLTPEVIGFKLTGALPEGSTATDLVLTVTEMLRRRGVVEKFVEFFGPGLAELSIPDRATIANMSPEYGATMGYFPIDAKTIEYLRFTAREPWEVELTEAYARANKLFWEPGAPEPEFTDVIELDLSTVEPCLAGPKRPQDRVALSDMRATWQKDLVDTFGKSLPSECVDLNGWSGEGGRAATADANPDAKENGKGDGEDCGPEVRMVELTEACGEDAAGQRVPLTHGSVVIAAITSCTNTSNPDVMIAAGLVARKARELGLTRKPWVKTSLAPGSKVVTEYYDKSGLTPDLEALGFYLVGYGCTTCIGNSGPLPTEIDNAVRDGDLAVASVLSGNRNFEGRVHPSVKANYLASPPLVVAYAIAGTVDIDLASDPIARAPDGRDVYLKDLYPWDDDSTYIQNPPFFEGMPMTPPGLTPIEGARVLCLLGDSVTTDHISPAGRIEPETPAGRYLLDKGVEKSQFNSYGSRRGNDRVMTRGTFANVRVQNRIAADEKGSIPEGGWTRNFTKGDTIEEAPVEYIYDAAQDYKAKGTPLVVIAGTDYGMGSSRDWAAKGTLLLGVRAVIATSFERIHRSNLVFMGVLPLVFAEGATAESLGIKGDEAFDIMMPDEIEPGIAVPVRATRPDGSTLEFETVARLDTPVEIEYYRNGGILQTVIRKKLNEAGQPA